MKKPPLISVVIVNYNASRFLLACLEAVYQNHYPNFEVIVVDNGSVDGSIENTLKKFGDKQNFQLISNKKNLGPSLARNIGCKKAKGKYLAFLDNDTLPHPDWLVYLVKEMEADSKIGACQCKLLMAKNRKHLDYVGDYLSQYGFLVQKCQTEELDKGQYDQKFEILSAKSAGMGMRKDVFDKVGGFDPDYFIYVEETDLGWRVWLAGYKIIFVPDSIVYHEFGTTSIINPALQNYSAKFHGTKNYIMTLFKNLETINLIKILPVHIFLWLGIASWLIYKKQFKSGFYVFKGISWDLFHLPSIFKKRKKVQKQRVVSDKQIFPIVYKRIAFSYFYRKFANPKKVGHARSWSKIKR